MTTNEKHIRFKNNPGFVFVRCRWDDLYTFQILRRNGNIPQPEGSPYAGESFTEIATSPIEVTKPTKDCAARIRWQNIYGSQNPDETKAFARGLEVAQRWAKSLNQKFQARRSQTNTPITDALRDMREQDKPSGV